MNANIAKWVEALRSGEYKQVNGHLCKNGAYCCLGVACEVALKAGVGIEVKEIKAWGVFSGQSVSKVFDDKSGTLPDRVNEWLALRDASIYVEVPLELQMKYQKERSKESLADLNDTWEMSFEDIATCIEHTYKEVVA